MPQPQPDPCPYCGSAAFVRDARDDCGPAWLISCSACPASLLCNTTYRNAAVRSWNAAASALESSSNQPPDIRPIQP